MCTNITVREINSEQELKNVLMLRHQVFVDEQGIPEEIENDGKDSKSVHVIALDNDKPVGTARLTIMDDQNAVLARVAIHAEYRGKGIGKLLVQKLEASAKRLGVNYISLQPHYYLEKFYTGLGYRTIEGEEMVADHLLINMTKSLI